MHDFPGDRARVRVAFVAALQREISPLVRDWKNRSFERNGFRFRLFENGQAFVICGGIGSEAARRATEAVIQEVQPSRMVSVGFAGALEPGLAVGEVIEPGVVINANDGVRTNAGSGQHSLVSYSGIAGRGQKQKLRHAFGAALVDMEAAAVAQGAAARGIEFAALKVISDDADFAIPDMAHFVKADGEFRQAAFALHVALRPWLWGTTIRLARNSQCASRALCAAISDYLQREQVTATAQV